ncbi:MAG: SGNH/GDSL hydrolase family protein [Patulibacter minatonensis]
MHRTLRAAACLLAAAGSLGLTASAAQSKTLDIVIAGDSYSSGVGASGDNYGGTCLRNKRTWGEVYANLARAKGLTVNVNNVACGGGVVKDLDGQMAAVNSDTDLVLVTIGGNDVGFANIVIQCFTPVVSDAARCKSAVEAGKAKVPSVESAALERLTTLRGKLRPGAKVAVASYPYLANPNTYLLSTLFSPKYDAGKGARELGDLGDQTILSAAAKANAAAGYQYVTFVPVKDRFVGHEPNQDPYVTNPNRWVNEFDLAGPYHPNDAGYAAMGAATMSVAGTGGDFGVSQ